VISFFGEAKKTEGGKPMLKLRIPYAKLIEQDIKEKLRDMLDIVDCDFNSPLKLTDYPDTEEVGIGQEPA
jgi:hypothetical protein